MPNPNAMPHVRAILDAAVKVAMGRQTAQQAMAAAFEDGLTPEELDRRMLAAAEAAHQLDTFLDQLVTACADAQVAHDAQAN